MRSPFFGKHISLMEIVLGGLATGLFALAGVLNQRIEKPLIVLGKEETALNINKKALLIFNLGNKRLLADLLWIQTLIESDEVKYQKQDLNSWMFLRFLNISILDPKFYENYLFGGQYLSIVKDDLLGAAQIYEKGLEQYPYDYQLNYNAGFNYYFEMGDYTRGLERLEAIKDHPSAPPFISSIIGKLRFEVGKDYEAALVFLKNSYQEAKDEGIKSKIEKDIYGLQAEIDLKCLNEHKTGCSTKDIYGAPYVMKGDLWTAPREFQPYRLRRKMEVNK